MLIIVNDDELRKRIELREHETIEICKSSMIWREVWIRSRIRDNSL